MKTEYPKVLTDFIGKKVSAITGNRDQVTIKFSDGSTLIIEDGNYHLRVYTTYEEEVLVKEERKLDLI